MENIVLTVHLLLALALVGVVLIQRSEGGGLGMGSGGGDSVMSGRAAASALTKLTWDTCCSIYNNVHFIDSNCRKQIIRNLSDG